MSSIIPKVHLGLEDYYKLDQYLKSIQTERDKFNQRIKEALGNVPGLYEEGAFQARLSMQDRSTLNETRAIEYLRQKGLNQCIKLLPALDREMLELALYEGHLTQKELEHCIEPKFVYTLRVYPKGV